MKQYSIGDIITLQGINMVGATFHGSAFLEIQKQKFLWIINKPSLRDRFRCTLSSQRFRRLRIDATPTVTPPIGWLISPPAHSLRLQLVSKWTLFPQITQFPTNQENTKHKPLATEAAASMRPQVPPIPIEIKHSCVHENGAPYKKLEVRTSQPTILNTFTITGVEANMEVLY